MAPKNKIRMLALIGLAIMTVAIPLRSLGQDWAMYETFSRHAPAMVSVNIEIPKEYVLQRWEESTAKLRSFQERYSDIILGSTEVQRTQYLSLEDQIRYWQQNLEYIKQQLLHNFVESGAGYAIDPHYVATLTTVVRNADLGGRISLTRHDNMTVSATLHGVDPVTGIAVLRVQDATFENYVDLSRPSSKLPESSFIMAIQRPYQLLPSPETGIIQGYNRRLGLFEYENYIQTNLPLYPNNEGAPVFSASGSLIGMMAAEYHVGQYPGVSFVIPANIVAESVQKIMNEGQLALGRIEGVKLDQHQMGILIEEIERESRAAMAGLRKGDLIVGFDGREIDGRQERMLLNFYYSVKPNQSVELDVQRGQDRLQIEVPISERR